jgi:prepilin-type N-terminal cleavage/methylation domain-containing protein
VTQTRRLWASRAGFTLLEVMMAVLVLGTALVALTRMLRLGSLSQEADAQRAVALSLLRQEAELARARGYDGVETIAAAPVTGAPAYTRSVTAAGHGGGLKLVTVTVTWESPTAGTVSESVQLVVGDSVLPVETWEEP